MLTKEIRRPYRVLDYKEKKKKINILIQMWHREITDTKDWTEFAYKNARHAGLNPATFAD